MSNTQAGAHTTATWAFAAFTTWLGATLEFYLWAAAIAFVITLCVFFIEDTP